MNYYAVTINNKELTKKYKSIDSVYKELRRWPIGEVIIIAVERNEINQNIHYHILYKSEVPITSINDTYIWWQELETELEVIKYFNYCKKDGKYKIYNELGIKQDTQNTIYTELLELVKTYDSLKTLINENPNMIKYLGKLERLYKIFHYKAY